MSTRTDLRLPARVLFATFVALFALPGVVQAADTGRVQAPALGVKGTLDDPTFFPIAVWLQAPSNAERYRQAGINTYVGLWRGPTEEQLAALKGAGMRVVCAQNEVGLRHLEDPAIIGWMHGDEPDNAQAIPGGKGYGPPILPEKIVGDYTKIRNRDPSRPVLLNLGQGVAYDQYIGRGVRRGRMEDYPRYIEGCDIVSFDIYPVVHDKPEISGQLWHVARGVERLIEWSGGRKRVWNCIECTRISHPTAKATPHQVRAEVWMSIIHGSRGIIYFVHEWVPRFREAALLEDPEMLAAVTRLNRQIAGLAPVLNQPSGGVRVTVASDRAEVPVAFMAREWSGAVYVFAVGMRDGATRARIRIEGLGGAREVEVIDEHRTIPAREGEFEDSFEPWAVRLYRVKRAA